MAPEIGYRAASSAKHSATISWPPKTAGQVQKKVGPAKENPKPKSWKTVVRIDTKENPAAKDA